MGRVVAGLCFNSTCGFHWYLDRNIFGCHSGEFKFNLPPLEVRVAASRRRRVWSSGGEFRRGMGRLREGRPSVEGKTTQQERSLLVGGSHRAEWPALAQWRPAMLYSPLSF